ncbi:MAG: hypothetical protein ACPGQS_14135, partial [Bradymonadia bacterium]
MIHYRPIQASSAGIMLVCLLLILNASVEIDPVSPTVEWSQNVSADSTTRFELLNRVALRINQSFMEPDRVDPKKMFESAMQSLEANIPEFVMETVHTSVLTTHIKLGPLHQSITVGNLTSIWQTVFHISDVLKMLHQSKTIEPEVKKRIEQLACQGMLSTLDKHSSLLSEAALFELKQSTLGRFGGIGVVITSKNQSLSIIEV